jgi:DNA-binding MarR family transcriptional regulator
MTKALDPVETGSELREAVALLVRRFRAQGTLPAAQTSVLGRLVRSGPATTSHLAALERVRPQSMAHTIAELQSAGLVQRRPDPEDRRQVLIEPSDQGHASMEALRRDGVAWVSRAITDILDAREQALLGEAVALLRRLAESP